MLSNGKFRLKEIKGVKLLPPITISLTVTGLWKTFLGMLWSFQLVKYLWTKAAMDTVVLVQTRDYTDSLYRRDNILWCSVKRLTCPFLLSSRNSVASFLWGATWRKLEQLHSTIVKLNSPLQFGLTFQLWIMCCQHLYSWEAAELDFVKHGRWEDLISCYQCKVSIKNAVLPQKLL